MNVLFVCTGNTCRSPMAEAILNKLAADKKININALSAGILAADGYPASENSILAMEDMGLDIKDHKSRFLSKGLLDCADIVLTMSNSHKDQIIFQYPELDEKVFTILEFSRGSVEDIQDPFGFGFNVYKNTRDEILSEMDSIIKNLEELIMNKGYMIGLASDHGGFELKEEIAKYLQELNIEYIDYGTNSTESVDYPDYGKAVANAVISGEVTEGIVICGTGIGISLAANKVKGIRCALCSDTYSAEMSKAHNNANMLALGGRVLGVDLAKAIVKSFLDGKFEGGRHERRVNKIE